MPALLLPLIILGGIYGGIFTPTEAAVVSVVYGLLTGFCLKELTPDKLRKTMVSTIETSAMITLILGVSNLFGWILAYAKIPQTIAALVIPIVRTKFIYLIVLCLLMLIVGALMETLTSIVILAPILAPIGVGLGIDPLIVGMVFCLSLIIGVVTPPFGVNLFTVASTTGLSFRRGSIRSSAVYPFSDCRRVYCGRFSADPDVSSGAVDEIMHGFRGRQPD